MNNKINLWIRYLFPIFLAFFLGTLIFMLAQFKEPPELAWQAIIWFFSAIFLIWEIGWKIGRVLDKQLPWDKGAFKRLLVQLTITNLVGILIFLGSFIALNYYENTVLRSNNALGYLHILVTMAEAFIIVQIVNSFQIGYQLMQSWRTIQLASETLKKENAIANLEALRQRIDPLFLNDNFHTLEKIIQESPEKASLFLKELAANYQDKQALLDSSLVTVQQALKSKEPPTIKDVKSATTIKYKNRFLVSSGTRLYQIPIEEIVGFYKDDIVLLFTKHGKKYALDTSLEILNRQINPHHFFRINRQCIIHIRFLKEMRKEDNQLQVTMAIPFPKSLVVSQRNVAVFKRWLDDA